MSHRIVPVMTAKQKAIYKYSKNKPVLNWDINNKESMLNSGWNPLKSVNICFHDESETHERMSILIEIHMHVFKNGLPIASMPYIPYICNDIQDNIIAYGYFFEKDSNTKKINMTLRIKPFCSKERTAIYQDCQYFGLDHDEILEGNILNNRHILQSRFTISNELQDRALCTGVNFLHTDLQDFKYIVELVNDFIQTNKIREQFVPEIICAYPLLNPILQIPAIVNRNDFALYLHSDGYIGYSNYMAIASIGESDDNVIYISNVELV